MTDAVPATDAVTPEPAVAEPAIINEAAPKTDEPQPAPEPTEPAIGNETPETTPQEPAPPVDPKAEAQKQYLQELGKYEAEKSGFADALKSWEERSKDGKKLAGELSTRFEAWYYVISADSFEKLRPARADVVGPKEAAKAEDTSIRPHFDNPLGGIPGLGE